MQHDASTGSLIGAGDAIDRQRRGQLLSDIDEFLGAMHAVEDLCVKNALKRKECETRFETAYADLDTQKLSPEQLDIRKEALILRLDEDITLVNLDFGKEIEGAIARLRKAEETMLNR